MTLKMGNLNTKNDIEYHRIKVRQWRAKHKQEGLCRYCNEPVVKGSMRCQKHIEYYRVYRMARRMMKANQVKQNGRTTN